MDFSTVTVVEWSYLAVMLLGAMAGRALACETRVLSGLLILAVLTPGNFTVVALAWIVGAILLKIMFQFQSWV